MDKRQHFSYLTSEIDAVYHEASQKLHLSDSAMRILYVLSLKGGNSLLSDVINLSGISKQTINSALRKLERDGIVETQGSRTKHIYLTERGEALAQNSALRVLRIEDEILSSWSEAELESYINLTERYLSAFKEKIKEL